MLRAGICFCLSRRFICQKDLRSGAAGTILPSSRLRRHMFSSFSPFHMPERLLPQPGRSFFSELLLRAGICFSLFRRFICQKDLRSGAAGTFLPSSRPRRHMFMPFSLFHMPERLLPRPCWSFFAELLLRAGICFCPFHYFICRSTFLPCRGIVFGRRFGLLWRVFLEKRLIFGTLPLTLSV